MTRARSLSWTACAVLALAPTQAAAQAAQPWLRDRGPGIRTSLLGSYVRRGELLIYPFYEYYRDHDLEYKPIELGYGASQTDYRGQYRANEGILFFGYGVSSSVALEFEAAVIDATLETSPSDTSTGRPPEVQESGLGDVEGQVRWRFQQETASRPEFFTYLGAVAPLQKDKHLIGTQTWEVFGGVGFVRGYGWGTLTIRVAAEYADGILDAGEYAFEWLRRFSPRWRVVAGIEGTQVDEVSLLTEVQWHFSANSYLKLNNALGLTQNATDIAPEIGVLIGLP